MGGFNAALKERAGNYLWVSLWDMYLGGCSFEEDGFTEKG